MDFLRSGYLVVVRICAIYYQRCKKICNVATHITKPYFSGRCHLESFWFSLRPDWIIFSTFITLYHRLPAITNGYQGLNLAQNGSYGVKNAGLWLKCGFECEW